MKKTLVILLLSVAWATAVNAQTAKELYNSGLAKYEQKDYNGALQDLNRAIEMQPGFDKAWHNRGLVKYSMQDYAGAMADQDKAISLNPNYPNAYNDRGLIWMKQKNYDA